MENISPIGPVIRKTVAIDAAAHWFDHRFEGRAVLPAVEAMQLLAHWTGRFRAGTHLRCIGPAAFDKFLELPPGVQTIEAACELTDLPSGGVQAILTTRSQGKSSAITRTKIHAQVVFHPAPPTVPAIALDLAAALEGPCFSAEPVRLYETLVPFGPAYRNISKPLQLTREGALALIQAPDIGDRQTGMPLGSPFVSDAAFHAACVWSQRFADVVAFPVGFAERRIENPTRAGETYVSRIFPVGKDGGTLVFDIWILDLGGGLRELLKGVRMRDVSAGRLRPADWIGRARAASNGRAQTGTTMALVERHTVMPFAERCLSSREQLRSGKMGPGRKNAFLAARLACKRLSRALCGQHEAIPAHEIDTLSAGGIRPICPTAGQPSYYCSVAHDRRFAVAMAAEQPVGVDVETPPARLLDALHLFMKRDEQARTHSSELGPKHAAVRVWSIKEAVAKALNITLADAWLRTEVIHIGSEESWLCIDCGPAMQAYHRDVEDHVVTWVVIKNRTLLTSFF